MARNNNQKGLRPAAPAARAKAPELRSRRPGTIDDAAADVGGEGHAPPAPGLASPDEIAARAYEVYLSRGAAPGRALDDWLQAERELCFPGFRD